MEEKRAWAEVDLSAARRNFESIRRMAGVPVIAVVKANAYGHGAVPLGRLYEALGALRLAVATLGEARALRRGGIRLPILILGAVPPLPDVAREMAKEGLIPAVVSLAHGEALSSAAERAGVCLPVDLKVDTGMGRLGVLPKEAEAVPALFGSDALRPLGIFTHFYSGADPAATLLQCRVFDGFRARLRARGVEFPLCHGAATAALPHTFARYGAVRVGLGLYGYAPVGGLSPILRLFARCVHLKDVPQGATLSYGGFRAPRAMRVATVSVGYGDGFCPPSGTVLTVGGAPCPVLGRVCMDMTLLDVSAADVFLWDAVPLGMWAEGEDVYRALTGIRGRVERMYTENGCFSRKRETPG